ncbi:TniQ family protein [Fictibacillus nanhaiensis]|uniref:TniQ family protein n=1 Tax=Fictibacillus nanhaiensis TaxID=742169 RepID=UPI001C97DE88|nr:TniQ family protein [Fictibacillus nanhaiensis]MBY6038326.1 TniQ family protein [Fictibacillus nanhaiensis]
MFTIRIKPKVGESLTSYLYRLTNENKTNLINLANTVVLPGKKRYTIINLDLSIKNNYNIEMLANLTGLSIESLLSLTIVPYHTKFDLFINMLNKEFETNVRKVCPLCISKDKYFKLIWQVKEIDICNEHLVKLQKSCGKCGLEFQYNEKDLMLNHICGQCKNPIINVNMEDLLSLDKIGEQERIYNDWSFLLSQHIEPPIINGYSTEDSLVIKYIYFIHQQKQTEYIPIPFFQDFYNNLIASIRKGAKFKKNRNLTPINLFRTLRYFNVELQDFYKLQVPSSFIEKIKGITFDESGDCLAPWCEGFNKKGTLKKAEMGRVLKYKRVTICEKCNLTYGYNKKNNNWENIDKIIQDYKVYSQNLYGIKKLDDFYKCNNLLSDFRMNFLLGYLLNHSLINIMEANDIKKNLNQKQMQLKKLILKTKSVLCLRSMAREQYGWNDINFFFVYHTTEIQRYLFFDLKRDRKINKDKELKIILKKRVESFLDDILKKNRLLTLEMVAQGIDINVKTLRKYGLNEIVVNAINQQKREHLLKEKAKFKKIINEYIKHCIEDNIRPNSRVLFKLLGTTHSTLKKNHPDICDLIKTNFKMTNEILHTNMLNEYKIKYKVAISKIINEGNFKLAYSRINKEAQLGVDYLRRYPELRVFVDTEIKNCLKQ